jgi:LDH2 family malate/lactate/ureidoglycolate dehydrogenase
VLLPIYVRAVKHKTIKLGAKTKKAHETQSIVLMDGDHGFGQVTGVNAMDTAIEKAKVYGVGVVSVFNANHFGMAAYYALRAIEHDMIGILMSNTCASMPAFGGREAVLSNGPICFGFPARKEPPIIVDMATSVKNKSAIAMAERLGKKIPVGWALDKHGQACTDPSAAMKGTLVPLGGIKGYCLAVVVEILSGVLSGALLAKEQKTMQEKTADSCEHPEGSGYFMMALNIESFMQIKRFEDRINDLIRIIKSSERAKDVKEIFLPGEREFREETRRLKEGIPIDPKIWLELTELAKELNMELPPSLEGEFRSYSS